MTNVLFGDVSTLSVTSLRSQGLARAILIAWLLSVTWAKLQTSTQVMVVVTSSEGGATTTPELCFWVPTVSTIMTRVTIIATARPPQITKDHRLEPGLLQRETLSLLGRPCFSWQSLLPPRDTTPTNDLLLLLRSSA